MKIKMTWLLPAIAAAALAACGGGSSDTVDDSTAAKLAELPEVKYATGCVPEQPLTPGGKYSGGLSTPSYSSKTEITVLGSLSQPTAVVSVEVRDYDGGTCTLQKMRLYGKGLASFSADTKTLTARTGAATKIGRKAQLTVAEVSVQGVTLTAPPIGAVVNFVMVDEGDKLYFGRGRRGSDGYAFQYSDSPALKQP